MIHLVIDNEGRRVEYAEPDALWLAARSTIVECKVPHYDSRHSATFLDPHEYTVYHPGTRNGRMITLDDINLRLREKPVSDRTATATLALLEDGPRLSDVICRRCNKPLTQCVCPARLM